MNWIKRAIPKCTKTLSRVITILQKEIDAVLVKNINKKYKKLVKTNCVLKKLNSTK